MGVKMTMIKKITNRVIVVRPREWKNFKFLQPSNFKNLSKKDAEELMNSIINNNFVETFKVWEDKSDNSLYCLDGYHRCWALRTLESTGYQIPDRFQCEFIQCDSKREAAKLVLVYSSRYAQPTVEGTYRHMDMYNILDSNIYGLDRNMRTIMGEVGDRVQKTGQLNPIKKPIGIKNAPDISSNSSKDKEPVSPTDNLNMVSVFFTLEEHEMFERYNKILRNKYDTQKLSDVILSAMREGALNYAKEKTKAGVRSKVSIKSKRRKD
jgi:hypothetical protein